MFGGVVGGGVGCGVLNDTKDTEKDTKETENQTKETDTETPDRNREGQGQGQRWRYRDRDTGMGTPIEKENERGGWESAWQARQQQGKRPTQVHAQETKAQAHLSKP